MAVTATPIFAQTPNVGAMNAILSTAMTNTSAYDGTQAVGTSMALCYTAGSNGSRVDQINVRLSSTNGAAASGTSSASVIRFWINNGSANTTAGNNIFLGELAIPATNVTALATAINPVYSLVLPPNGLNLLSSYRIYAGATVAAGGTAIAFAVQSVGGDY